MQKRYLTEQEIESSDKEVFIVYDDPIMESAMEVLEKFNKTNVVILRGKGKTIPVAVAIANIIESNFLKGNSKIKRIQLDSEIPNDGRMISNIEITLEKNN